MSTTDTTAAAPTAAAHARVAPEDRIPVSQKVGYGLGTFIDMWGHWLYPNIAFQVFGMYLGVASWLIGVALILNRMIDAVSDPLFGWLSDNTRSRWGRRRPFMFVGAIVAGLGLPLLVGVNGGWGTTHLFGKEISNYFWFMIGSSALYLPVVSCFNMPWVSLGNELTPDYHERTSLFSYKYVVQKIPEVGLFFAGQFFTLSLWDNATYGNLWERLPKVPAAVLARLNQLLFTAPSAWNNLPDSKPNILIGGQVFCAIAGVGVIIMGLTCVALVRERYYSKLVVAGKQEKISIKETLWQTLQCEPFRAQVVMNLAYALGTSMVGTLGFAATMYYVCGGRLAEGNGWNFLMGLAGMVMGGIGVPVFGFIARRIGKKPTMGIVFSIAILVFVSTWWLYDPNHRWMQLLACGSIAFTGGGFWMLFYSLLADVVDYDELKTGRRREGSFSACVSWISKVGMALGAGFSFFILDWVGYNPELGGNQSAHTLFMIRLLLAIIPIVGLGLALVALAKYPLTQEKMAEIRLQLEARRGKV
ncbi:hypothetical protein DB347_13020 [Opitutaceae bacterium EW11]|nr:hypothetical protein DB347_13020 [Opitutaceae bacterium EW11]